MTATATRSDVYTNITNKIIAAIEQGLVPWFCPWNAKHAAGSISRPLRCNGQPYRGINIIQLWATGFEKGYTAPYWMTFQQAKELGGNVKKGEKATQVVYANTFKKEEIDNTTGEVFEQEIPYLRQYNVFCVDQTENLPAHFYARAEPPKNIGERLQTAEQFFAATKAEIRHGGNRAYYSPDDDYIQLPPYDSFKDRESYYCTLAHEFIHLTKHPRRLNRDLGKKRFGDSGYAMEELVAELGSAFLSADLGITAEPRGDHAGYIQSWLKVLKSDNRALFTAASMAERAVAYLHELQPK